jgi:molybdopterin synthase catalytic subunit
MPTYRIKLFAAHREAAGRAWVVVDLPAGARVREAREALARAVPGLLGRPEGVTVIAVNGQFSADERLLRVGDELAAFPPVAGG